MRIKSAAAILLGLLLVGGCATPRQTRTGTVSKAVTVSKEELLRRQVLDLVGKHQFQDARELVMKSSLDDNLKAEIIKTLIDPAEARFTADRILAMIAQVEENLERGDDEGARQAIYNYGITGQSAVDTIVYLSKCHYLNTSVNPATLSKWERFVKRYVDGSIKSGDFQKAFAAARRIPRVDAYPSQIDELLELTGEAALDQHTDPDGTAFVGELAKAYLYGLIATRDGDEKNPLTKAERSLRARVKPLIPPEEFEPDWLTVESRLKCFKQALLDDDMDEDVAEDLVNDLLKIYKSLVVYDRGLTTFDLNDRLAELRRDSLYRVAQALEEALRKAEADRLEALRKLWLSVAAAMAETVDSSDRERAMLAAISDRAEPGIDRILGEGCRVLRLYRQNKTVSKEQATSLLVAAVYMGFDDVMDMALAFGADINGSSEKDCLGRTPYLLALQYGFKGKAEELLAAADASKRDANGAGAVHYAVRGGDAKVLLSLLRKGLDAKSAANDGTTPLMLAVDLRNGPMVRMLMGGSDIDAADNNGWTALHFAANWGDLDIVKALVGVHAATDKKTNEGDTLLSLGVKSNSQELLAYLLDELKLPADERAVSRCVIEGWLWPLKILVEHGGELTDRHLAAAAKCGHLAVVKWLVERGHDVNSDAVHGVGGGSGEVGEYLRRQGYRSCN